MPPGSALVDEVLSGRAPAFALLHRPQAGQADRVEVLVGEVDEVARLADLPIGPPGPATGQARHTLLTLVPYRQIAERGFAAADDGTPLVAMRITGQDEIGLAEAFDRIPEGDLDLVEEGFDISDERYAGLVRQVISNEIGRGEGANFVLRRSFLVRVENYTPAKALTVFRRLLHAERSAYWTFVVHTGTTTLVGATPERHVSLRDGVVSMNPISGTYRYAESGPNVNDALRFLADAKEADELFMVVDEELKMMAALCPDGGQVLGPYLKEMSSLAHTEYYLEGRSEVDVRDILRTTMFAPTVTGSPLESACRVLARYEPEGRGYYSGVIGLIGVDPAGRATLDSAILIRTGQIDPTGHLRIGVGATLVRNSRPESEVVETTVKAAGVLAALRGGPPAAVADRPRLGTDTLVVSALRKRNTRLARFWFDAPETRGRGGVALPGLDVLVIDAEDTFTTMLGLELGALGTSVTIRRFDEPFDVDAYDLTVVGPGPGNPAERDHPKIARLRQVTRHLLRERMPFLSVCLGHQVLSDLLGLPLVRRAVPNQGTQKEIDLFGWPYRVGFYNTYAATVAAGLPDGVRAAADPTTGEIHALRGPHFRSMQFHPESVLTENGVAILRRELTSLLATERAAARPA
ncbi:anthranilate synthase family protein [Actinophytocola sp.]|uniref:anthranilate synthase family protein n=1 Tax=Actinophytocola sp. TaxID=1872138 RepID=UPI002D7FF34C|nr:anthranilate synthase family protein [Actinophytocola sp.]